jgi:hypothetical protein
MKTITYEQAIESLAEARGRNIPGVYDHGCLTFIRFAFNVGREQVITDLVRACDQWDNDNLFGDD